jgi:Uma2 family endonuclease
MGAVAPQTVTAEAFWQLPETEYQRELVRGEVVETMPAGGRHGIIAARLVFRLQTWIEQGAGGYVGVESGFILGRNPDTVRAPDVFYVRADRIPEGGVPEAFWDMAPDLAVEIVSPSESADEVREKVRDYLAAGTPLVWVVYPRSQEVLVHTPDGAAYTYSGQDILQHADMLPGFTCVAADLFP